MNSLKCIYLFIHFCLYLKLPSPPTILPCLPLPFTRSLYVCLQYKFPLFPKDQRTSILGKSYFIYMRRYWQ